MYEELDILSYWLGVAMGLIGTSAGFLIGHFVF